MAKSSNPEDIDTKTVAKKNSASHFDTTSVAKKYFEKKLPQLKNVLDSNYTLNKWVYLHFSPIIERTVNCPLQHQYNSIVLKNTKNSANS